jgi:type IV pilus assembly protein PilM
MAVNTTTLYIDNLTMRLMVTRGKRVTKLADMPLDVSLGEIDTPEKEAQLAEKIKHLFQSNRIATRKIILGLSGLHCLTRPITLPELPKAMLEEAVTREARRVLPVPVEQLYISWQIVSAAESKIQAFMVAIPRHIADMIIRIVNHAGFKPYLMDIKPLALARLAREPNSIIVDVQPSEFDIIIMVSGMPQPIRTVPFPRETPSLTDRLVIVRDELQRTVQFFNSNNAETKIQTGTTLLVSGEIAEENEMCAALGEELGFKVVPLTSPLKCLKHLDPSHHLVNVGLALKELGREAGPLLPNFSTLPAPYQPKQISMNKLAAVPAIAIAVGLLIVLGMTVKDAAAGLESVKTELDANKVLLEKRTAQKKELNNGIATQEAALAGLNASIKNYTDALNSLTGTGDKMNDDLTTTVNNVVNDLEISTMNINGTKITLSGKASSEQEVFQYVRKLTGTGRFDEITINNLSVTPDSTENDTQAMNYNLILKIKVDKK